MKPIQLLVITTTLAACGFAIPTRLAAQAPPQKQNPQTQKPSDAPPEASKSKSFRFEGGNIRDFIEAIKKQLGVDLFQHGDIPRETLYSVRVPKMRLEDNNLRSLLNFYNQLSGQGIRDLGKWVWLGNKEDGIPSTIVLVPPAKTDSEQGSQIAVRAFSLRGISEKDRELLKDTIQREAGELEHRIRNGQFLNASHEQISGLFNFHSDSEILVASGGRTYVELVQSLVEAFRERNGRSTAPAQATPNNPK